MAILKVKDNINLVRDSETGVIINTNDDARNSAIARREAQKRAKQQLQQNTQQIDQLSNRVSSIEDKLNLILDLLQRR